MLLKRCFGFGMILLCIAGLCCVPPGETECLLLFGGIAGLLVLLLDDELLQDMESIIVAFLCAHWSVLLRLPVYYIQRSWMLRHEKVNWVAGGPVRISRKSWNHMPEQEKIELVLDILKQETEKQNCHPCRIVPYCKEYREACLWVQVDGAKQRILWNTASVEYCSLQTILEELILATQRYRYYCRLNAREQQVLNSFAEKQYEEQFIYWNYLLYESLRLRRSREAYDIITRQYARTKSSWYSENTICE